MSYIQLTYKPIPEKLPIPLTTWVLGPKIERKNNIGTYNAQWTYINY